MLYSLMFYAIFQFCGQVKLKSLDGNIANKKVEIERELFFSIVIIIR